MDSNPKNGPLWMATVEVGGGSCLRFTVRGNSEFIALCMAKSELMDCFKHCNFPVRVERVTPTEAAETGVVVETRRGCERERAPECTCSICQLYRQTVDSLNRALASTEAFGKDYFDRRALALRDNVGGHEVERIVFANTSLLKRFWSSRSVPDALPEGGLQ